MKIFLKLSITMVVLLTASVVKGQNIGKDSVLNLRPREKNFYLSKEQSVKLRSINLRYQKSIDSLIKDHAMKPDERYKAICLVSAQKNKEVIQLLGQERAEQLRRYIDDALMDKRLKYQMEDPRKKSRLNIKQ